MKNPVTLSFFALILAFSPLAAVRAQTEPPEAESLFDYLNSHGPLIEMVLQTDMEELINNRRRVEYQPATLAFTDKSGQEIQWEIGAVPRGNYRRHICGFPPIRLNFTKGQLLERGLNADYDKLKLVAHCMEEQEGEDIVLKEYLAYKIYNQLTSNSFRVQLVKITYQDIQGRRKEAEHFGILIEETDELARRLGGVESEIMNQPPEAYAVREENLMSVFQYMIGNGDWDVVMLRNVKLIQGHESGLLIPVPYDFDFSGFVDASYAVPNSQLGLANVRQRSFQGHPVEKEVLQETLKHFKAHRSQIKAIIKNFEWLNATARRGAIEYIDSFYGMGGTLIKENARKLKEQKGKEESSVRN